MNGQGDFFFSFGMQTFFFFGVFFSLLFVYSTGSMRGQW